MRVLFSCSAGEGHFLPLVPLARAFRDRGDDVAVATGASLAHRVEEAGLVALPAGLSLGELDARYAPEQEEIKKKPVAERRRHAYAQRVARIDAPARADDLYELARRFEPNVLVHETSELAAPLVAARLGLPSVHHGFGRLVPAVAIRTAYPFVAEMWERAGVEPDPQLGLFRGMFVDICPRSLEPEQPPAGTRILPRRVVDAAAPAADQTRPLIYVTLGTVVRNAPLLRAAIAALASSGADVLVTTGAQNADGELGELPANTIVESYVPQAEVLPRASLVVTHAGSGSMLGALAHGLPLLALPQMADQFENAAACARAGAARVLAPDEATTDAIRDAAESLLADGAYRRAAEAVAAEIAAMPSASDVAQEIATLCLNGRAPA